MTKRMMARVPDDVAEKIVRWSERLGVTQSQLMGMAIQAGIDSIIRAVDPSEAFTPQQIAAILKAAQDDGVQFINPEGNNESTQNGGRSGSSAGK